MFFLRGERRGFGGVLAVGMSHAGIMHYELVDFFGGAGIFLYLCRKICDVFR